MQTTLNNHRFGLTRALTRNRTLLKRAILENQTGPLIGKQKRFRKLEQLPETHKKKTVIKHKRISEKKKKKL